MSTYSQMPQRPTFPPGGGPTMPPPQDDGPSMRERVARAKTIARRAAGHWKAAFLLLTLGCAIALVAAWNSKRAYRSECVVQFKAGLSMGGREDDNPNDRAARLAPKLRDELTTRARLESVIREFSLYSKTVESRGMTEAVDEMRDKYVGFRGKGDSSTFVISFEAEDPELAQKVTQRLADTMIDEYTKGNMSAVVAQEAFLATEEARAEHDLEAANKAFAQFLAAHPEYALELRRSGGTGTAGGAAQVVIPPPPSAAPTGDPQLAALDRQRKRLAGELTAAQTGAPPPVMGTPAQEARVAKARRDRDDAQKAADDANTKLAALRAQGLKDDWPDVRAAQAELARSKAQLVAAEASVREAEQDIRASSAALPSARVDVEQLKKQLADIDAQIMARRSGRPLPAKPATANDSGTTAPTSDPANSIVEDETEWQRLLRALQETKANHDDLNQKLERARLEKSRAQAKGGDTMAILDPAYRPTKPSKGGRSKVALTGGALALMVALLYAFARVIFNDTMIDAQDVEALKLIPVLGTLPRIPGAGVHLVVAQASPQAQPPQPPQAQPPRAHSPAPPQVQPPQVQQIRRGGPPGAV